MLQGVSSNYPSNQISNGINSNWKNKTEYGNYYAKKGEPMYQKDMDEDEDGVVTFEEFNDYCDANGISVKDRQLMLQNRISWHLTQEMKEKSKEIKEKDKNNNQEEERVYAKSGEPKYEAEMDADSDGVITYDEYMKYCEENGVSDEKEQSAGTVVEKVEDADSERENVRPVNIGKALNTYAESETEAPESKIEGLA